MEKHFVSERNGRSQITERGRRSPRHSRIRFAVCGMLYGVFCSFCLFAAPASAGVTAESTRVIFSTGAMERSLQLVNVNAYPVIVQAWVDNGELDSVPEESKSPIIPLPPIFRMNRGDQTSLRLIYSGEPLADDRESVFWLNLYEIPPNATDLPPESELLTVTMRTQMKVFVRPEKLPFPADEMPGRLAFSLKTEAGKPRLTIANPTPYFATISALQVTGAGVAQEGKVDMISPFSEATLDLDAFPAAAAGTADIRFSVIGDDGNQVSGKRTVKIE
jgi:chaperone protein EcpD